MLPWFLLGAAFTWLVMKDDEPEAAQPQYGGGYNPPPINVYNPDGTVKTQMPPIPMPTSLPMPSMQEAPPGWPANVSFADCESLMGSLDKEATKTLLTQVVALSDAEWAARKAKMTSMGQGQLAECLDASRYTMSYLKALKI
jgi:hypothetical protein